MEIFLSLLSELSHKLEDQEHRYQSIVQTMQQRITALENALQTGDVQNSRQRIQDMELRMDTWEEGEERRVAAAAARVIREEIAAMRADTGK
jgi:hypothetical protein